MAPIDAVFVDVDNTLYDIDESLARTVAATHAEFEGHLGADLARFEAAYWAAAAAVADAESVIQDDVDRWRTLCLGGALERLGRADAALVPQLVEGFNRHRRAAFVPFPGAIEAVRAVQDRHALGIITNGPSRLQREKLQAFGLLGVVDPELVLVSGELPWAKPAPEIFREAARRAGTTPERCVMVGDSFHHDMAAAAVGFRTVLVNAKRLPVPRMPVPPLAVVETPAELEAVLDAMARDGAVHARLSR